MGRSSDLSEAAKANSVWESCQMESVAAEVEGHYGYSTLSLSGWSDICLPAAVS